VCVCVCECCVCACVCVFGKGGWIIACLCVLYDNGDNANQFLEY